MKLSLDHEEVAELFDAFTELHETLSCCIADDAAPDCDFSDCDSRLCPLKVIARVLHLNT